jgi:hypothetical protein
MITGVGMLECGAHFARMHRINASVLVEDCKENGWIVRSLSYMVVRRVCAQPLEFLGD